jgi:hypothetical protein
VRSLPTSGSHGFLLVGLKDRDRRSADCLLAPKLRDLCRSHDPRLFSPHAERRVHVWGENGEKNPGCQPCSKRKTPDLRGFWKRMMGLEPTTFCMASRCSSQLSYIRVGCGL